MLHAKKMSTQRDLFGEAAEDPTFRRLFAVEWDRDCAQLSIEKPDLPALTPYHWVQRDDGWHWIAKIADS